MFYFVMASLPSEYWTLFSLFSLYLIRAAPEVTSPEFQGFMHPLSQQAFEYLFYLEFQGKELDGLFIYSLLKFLSIDEKIEGNINFFWKSEVMFRR